MNRVQFTRIVADKAFLEPAFVGKLLKIILETIPEVLLEETLILNGFGRFKLAKQSSSVARWGRDHFYSIKFKPSDVVKRKIIDGPKTMNKYSVVLDENKTIAAKLTKKCPDCGGELESTKPPKCLVCGTKPFESSSIPEDEEMEDDIDE